MRADKTRCESATRMHGELARRYVFWPVPYGANPCPKRVIADDFVIAAGSGVALESI